MVESKYKNPDRHIKRLKAQVKWQMERVSNRDTTIAQLKTEISELKEKAYGKEWFTLSDNGHLMNISLNASYHPVREGKIKIGTQIVCFGKVTGIDMDEENTSAKMRIKNVFANY